MKYVIFGAGADARYVIHNILKKYHDNEVKSGLYLVDNNHYNCRYNVGGGKKRILYIILLRFWKKIKITLGLLYLPV